MITKEKILNTPKAKELYNILMPIYKNLEDLVIGTMGHCETEEQRQRLIDAVNSGLTDWTKIMFFCWDNIDKENAQKIVETW